MMVTALDEPGDIERAVAAGCDDYLSKPIIKIALTIRVQNMLKFRHVADENERLRRYIDGVEDSLSPEHDKKEPPQPPEKNPGNGKGKGGTKGKNKAK
jgi:DNA-binding response OmpR family regulator